MGARLPAVWSTPMAYAADMVADATHAYVAFTYPGLEGIQKIQLSDGSVTTLWTQPAQRLLDDGNQLVVVAGNSGSGAYEIHTIAKSGGPSTLWCSTNSYIYGLTLTPTRLVLAQGFDGHRLVECPRGGAVVDRYVDAAATGIISKVINVGEELFFASGKDLWQLPAGSATPVVRLTITDDFMESLTADDTNVWATSGIYMNPGGYFASGSIYRLPVTGGPAQTILSLNTGVQGLTVGPTHLFFYNYGANALGRLVRLNHDGRDFTVLGWDRGALNFTLVDNRLAWTAYATEDPYPEGSCLRVLTVDP